MRLAADELRARLAGDTVTFVVNRNINFTNICQVGCAFCGFGQGKRSPDAYHVDRGGLRREGAGGGRLRRDRDLHAGRHPSRLHARGLRALAAAREGDVAPHVHLHAYSPMEVHFMCERSGKRAARRCSSTCSSAGSARPPAPRRRCCTTACASASPRTSFRSAAGSRSSRPRTAAGLRSTVTVMFGHIEEPWELAEHMHVVRELQERTGGFTEFVPLSFIPFHTLLGPHARHRGDLARGQPQAHGGVPARARRHGHEPPGELGQDGPRRRDRGLRWGVNDLGGTLMEESISRMAGSYHGVKLDPDS